MSKIGRIVPIASCDPVLERKSTMLRVAQGYAQALRARPLSTIHKIF